MNKQEYLMQIALKAYRKASNSNPTSYSRYISCLDPWVLMNYASHVDKRGHPVTRNKTIRHGLYLGQYACHIDGFLHPNIYKKLIPINVELVEEFLLEE